jgi:hypothetical protein
MRLLDTFEQTQNTATRNSRADPECGYPTLSSRPRMRPPNSFEQTQNAATRRHRADAESGCPIIGVARLGGLHDCRGCSTLSSRPRMRSLEALEQTQNVVPRHSRAASQLNGRILGLLESVEQPRANSPIEQLTQSRFGAQGLSRISSCYEFRTVTNFKLSQISSCPGGGESQSELRRR